MPILQLQFSRLLLLLMMLALISIGAAAQLDKQQTLQLTSPVVTAASAGDHIRFTAPGNIIAMRLEVFSLTGEQVFESGAHDGNVLDWRWPNEKALALGADNYLCVVTVQSLSGKTSRKLANISFANQKATFQPVEVAQLNSAQMQALGTTETDTPLTIIDSEQQVPATVIGHDGTDGQVTRTRGAISFRFGDFFRGTDREQMRLTEHGRLGIGTDNPQATLDVNGAIRARQGIEFSNGTTLNVDDKGALTTTASDGSQTVNISGTGTNNRVTKWIDGSNGVVGDSAITEVNGNVGIGTTNPGAPLHIVGSTETVRQELNNSNSFIQFGFFEGAVKKGAFGYQGSTSSGFVGGPGAMVFGTITASPVAFFTNGTEKVRLDTNGNFGIGVTSPATKLDVAGDINTSTGYNIGGNRILSGAGTNNFFAGAGAGAVNQGTNNTFVGFNAGNANTTNINFPANENSFFGSRAGELNTTGIRNSFFGSFAGNGNTTGNDNSIFGDRAGVLNNGSANAIFGTGAGFDNSSGSINSFFGRNAGNQNTTGSTNSFFGGLAGNNNTTGSNNSFFGDNAGLSNTAEDKNTFMGANSNGLGGITNATAIGANASVTQSNSLVLGSIAGVNGADPTADTNVGIGTTAPTEILNLQRPASASILLDVGSTSNTGQFHVKRGAGNSYIGPTDTGFFDFWTFENIPIRIAQNGLDRIRVDTSGNVGIDTTAPRARFHVSGGTSWFQGDSTPLAAAAGQGVAIGTSGGDGYVFSFDYGTFTSKNLLLNSPGGNVGIGTTTPQRLLDVNGRARIGIFLPDPSIGSVCFNGSGDLLQCGGSSLRLKRNVALFRSGLDVVRRLRPISFDWKDGSGHDIGLAAEDVAMVAPSLTFTNKDGELAGVKYERLNILLINAVKEQQTQIEAQQKQIDALKRLISHKTRHLRSFSGRSGR